MPIVAYLCIVKIEKETMEQKNKIIIFSNIKGGVGKTTLCSLFATYLAENGMPVAVLDAALHQSLYRHRVREEKADPEQKMPWQVTPLDTSDIKKVNKVMKELKKVPGNVLIDCPGNLNDKSLAAVYAAADVAVIPMSFDPDTVDATGIFLKALKSISNCSMVFVPNRINDHEGKAEERKQRAQTVNILELVGTVVPRIKQGVAIKRYSTIYSLESKQKKIVATTFDAIMKAIM